MAAHGVWGGGIWGSSTGSTDSAALKEGEEACTICHVRRLEIAMLPCKHRFCSECVTCLRKANVFKVGLPHGYSMASQALSGACSHLSQALGCAGRCRDQMPLVPHICRRIRPPEGGVRTSLAEHHLHPGHQLFASCVARCLALHSASTHVSVQCAG